MLRKSANILLTTFISLLLFPSASLAEESVETTVTTNNVETKMERFSELKAKKDLKSKEVLERHVASLNNRQERSQRLQTVKQERTTRIEELKLKRGEFEQKREDLKTKFNEAQIQRLNSIKERATLTSARYVKISETLYKMLERVTNIVQEKKEAGFDVSQTETTLSEIELKMAGLQSQQEGFQTVVDGLENLSAEEIPSALTDLKNSSNEIKRQFISIRGDIKQLIKTLK